MTTITTTSLRFFLVSLLLAMNTAFLLQGYGGRGAGGGGGVATLTDPTRHGV